MYSLILFFQSNETAVTLSSIIAFATLLNSLGVFALLFKIGKYIGTTDSRLSALETGYTKALLEGKGVADILSRHGESLARLEVEVSSTMKDVQIVRARQHDFANILARATLQPITLRPIEPFDSVPEREG